MRSAARNSRLGGGSCGWRGTFLAKYRTNRICDGPVTPWLCLSGWYSPPPPRGDGGGERTLIASALSRPPVLPSTLMLIPLLPPNLLLRFPPPLPSPPPPRPQSPPPPSPPPIPPTISLTSLLPFRGNDDGGWTPPWTPPCPCRRRGAFLPLLRPTAPTVRRDSKCRSASSAELQYPVQRRRAHIIVPVRPLPPLQCTLITFSASASSQARASTVKSTNWVNVGTSWSGIGKQRTRPPKWEAA